MAWDEKAATKQKKANQARIGLIVKILNNAGYALIGGPLFEPLVKGEALKPMALVWAATGVAALVYAIILAPHGGKADD